MTRRTRTGSVRSASSVAAACCLSIVPPGAPSRKLRRHRLPRPTPHRRPPPIRPALPSAADNQDAEVLTRGPVHEAFAQPLAGDNTKQLVVAKQPPDPIEEEPPAQKPDGQNVLWIPGYWAWDDDRTDFLWVSGIWRDAPPGQVWVAGYWSQVDGGYQWTSGFWTPSEQANVSYLPAAAGIDRQRAEHHGPVGRRRLGAGKLYVSRDPVRLAAWFLVAGSDWLDLGAGALHLDARRLCVCRRFLGLHLGPPGSDVRSGLFRDADLSPATLCVHAGHRDRRGFAHGQLFRPAVLLPLLLRRLLRPELCELGLPAVGFRRHRARSRRFRLRSAAHLLSLRTSRRSGLVQHAAGSLHLPRKSSGRSSAARLSNKRKS